MSAKVAIVTGAAQGIGRAIAVRLAADGFDIGVNDLPTPEQAEKLEELKAEIEKLGRKAIVVAGDVSQEPAVEKIVKDTVAAFGGLDVMVANAGTCELAPVVATPVEQWDATQGVNLRGVFLCFKHAGQQMLAQGKERGGRLIGGASLGGFSGVPMGGAYSASKAGMRGLTHSAARELGPNGITVNSYAPGIVVTPLTLRNFGAEFLESQKPSCALGDHGTPEDIAALVAFLASKESRFITGQTIMIDGGRLCI
ncbi:acetoin reductase family protein [Dentipellis sp. KUC8613]|nr:acetoin reductase family protein [Dentipellis sp. KUC8613]